jgi:hypothetical protein
MEEMVEQSTFLLALLMQKALMLPLQVVRTTLKRKPAKFLVQPSLEGLRGIVFVRLWERAIQSDVLLSHVPPLLAQGLQESLDRFQEPHPRLLYCVQTEQLGVSLPRMTLFSRLPDTTMEAKTLRPLLPGQKALVLQVEPMTLAMRRLTRGRRLVRLQRVVSSAR